MRRGHIAILQFAGLHKSAETMINPYRAERRIARKRGGGVFSDPFVHSVTNFELTMGHLAGSGYPIPPILVSFGASVFEGVFGKNKASGY